MRQALPEAAKRTVWHGAGAFRRSNVGNSARKCGTDIAIRYGAGAEPRSEAVALQRRRVLIVEDNHDNRAIFAAILQHHGYEVLEAADGENGVRVAQEEHPDVILMDISLPHMDGLQATALLKGSADTSGIPIIAVTAHAMREDEIRVRKAGCDSYLAKPVEPMRVVREVSRMIGESHADPARSSTLM
jgi:two-component system, cell cycle response regulator DivK